MPSPDCCHYLRVFGAPALLAHGCAVAMRNKDLALVAYLALSDVTTHARSTLATLLWDVGSEADARHSLSQALFRVRAILSLSSLAVTRQSVTWRGPLFSDAEQLRTSSECDGKAVVALYTADFMSGLVLGPGARDFEDWADKLRERYRLMVLRRLSACAAGAEQRGEWEDVLALGSRAVEIEPLFEEGHRKVIRAWTALGDRALALRHYQRLKQSLREEAGADPDPSTCAMVAALIRTGSVEKVEQA